MRIALVLVVALGAFGCSSGSEIGSRAQVRTASGGASAARATVAVYASEIPHDSVHVQVFATAPCDASPEMSPAVGWHVGWAEEADRPLDALGRAHLPRSRGATTLSVGPLSGRPDLAVPLSIHREDADVVLVWLVPDPDPGACDIT